jgi:hypothetical protein
VEKNRKKRNLDNALEISTNSIPEISKSEDGCPQTPHEYVSRMEEILGIIKWKNKNNGA